MRTPIETFEQLVNKNESETLDFKQEHYLLSAENGEVKRRNRAKFVKDIISMANTPRQESSYIVFGVKCLTNGQKELVGLDKYSDDADLQSVCNSMCHPHPRFKYDAVQYDGKSFAYIEIPVDTGIGPFVPLNDSDKILRQHAIYFRRGSQNSLADPTEQRRIYQWFQGALDIRTSLSVNEDPVWDQILRASHGFDPARKYLLVTCPGIWDGESPAQNLANIPWTYVVDFDHESSKCGLLSTISTDLSSVISVHRVTLEMDQAISPAKATYWYFSRGIEGRQSTLSLGPWIEWQRMYGRDLRERLIKVSCAINSPITLIILWNDIALIRHLDTLLRSCVNSFGECINIIIIGPDAKPLHELAEVYQAEYFTTPISHFFHGLGSVKNVLHRNSAKVLFPSNSGAEIEFNLPTVAWLREELELVHINIGLSPENEDIIRSGFLRGRVISWFEMALHLDVDRDITEKLEQSIRRDLEKRVTSRINLYHAPGAGGTTVARRVLWNFRNQYPTVIVNHSQPSETVERIQKIFSETGQSILIKVDGNLHSDRLSDELYTLLSASNTPFVMLQVLRRFGRPELTQRAFYLERELSAAEGLRFCAALTREVPTKKMQIEAAINSPDGKHKSPFYLGLVAFERDFSTIESYVKSHLTNLSEVQIQIITFLAIAHYYGQQAISAQSFAETLNTPRNRQVFLEKALPEVAHTLLIYSDNKKWRTIHHIIAEEIIHQTLSSPSSDKRVWQNRLADWAIDFADFCNHRIPEPADESIELVRRVFIYRNESELLGSENTAGRSYSQIITDIPVEYGKERVLRHLTELFPEEAHFWAHLARFLANDLKQYDEAIKMADRALSIQPEDHVLHHMKGMIYRSHTYEMMQRSEDISTVLEKAKLASLCFADARKAAPDDEYGFISDAQLIVRVIDYVGKSTGKDPVSAVAEQNDSWLRESFQAVEDLLMQVRQKNRDRADSNFALQCQARLNALYGRHESALQIWDNLLGVKKDIFAPPIRRQIIWVLLARRDRNWSGLKAKEIERSVKLLEDNIRDEPNNESNLRLWIQAVRHKAVAPTVETATERVAYWAANTDTLEANYYLYILNILLTISGSTISIDQAIRSLEKCRERARYRRDKTRSYEWLGRGEGLKKLVHREKLGDWDESQRFWNNPSPLQRIEGVISRINGPQAGTIEFAKGLEAFFVPGVSGHARGKSENDPVTFYLGFSYDGPRAWSVLDE